MMIQKHPDCSTCTHHTPEGYLEGVCRGCLNVTEQRVVYLPYYKEKNAMSKGYDEAFRTEGSLLDRRSEARKAQLEAEYKAVEKEIEKAESASDPVEKPYHYTRGNIEPITAIEDWKLNYNLGNAVKYISRCQYKWDKKQDIEKAIWYLKRELEHGCN